MNLAEREILMLEPDAKPLAESVAIGFHTEIPLWQLSDKIIRTFKFNDFCLAMDFVNMVAELANEVDHHPDIEIHYNRVRLEPATHSIGGLSINDFIMAAKIDKYYKDVSR